MKDLIQELKLFLISILVGDIRNREEIEDNA